MLTRLVALAVVGGLGVGLVLRIWLGRGRFSALVTGGLLPVVVHAGITFAVALRAGIDPLLAGGYLALALAIAITLALIGRRNVDERPWLAAFAPLIGAAAYAATALLLIGLALDAAGHALNVLAVAGLVTGSIFATCALVSFAPQAPGSSARR